MKLAPGEFKAGCLCKEPWDKATAAAVAAVFTATVLFFIIVLFSFSLVLLDFTLA